MNPAIMTTDSFTTTNINKNIINTNKLDDQWTLWAHLPQNTDWSMASYIKINDFVCLEDAIVTMKQIPNSLIECCMLFLMKKHILPRYEDPCNINGGEFSYKVLSKHIAKCWTELTYCCVGNTISLDEEFVRKTNGITISPKKNFSIIKIWMSDCSKQNPQSVVQIPNLNNFGSFFKKHPPGS